MKKLALFLAAVMLAFSFAGCSDSDKKDTDKIKIAIVQPMEHTSLNEIRDAIVAELKAKGYDESKAEIILKNANGDSSMLPTVLNSVVANQVDIIIPIATGTAQAAAAATDSIPIVFAAVSDPVAAGLVKELDKTDKNITGVSDAIAVEQIFELAGKLTPDAKTFGFVYNASEPNSNSCITRAKSYCDANGIKYKEVTVAGTADIQLAVTSIARDVDAFFTPDDNTVASAMGTYAQIAIDAKKPIYVGADSMVKDGGFGTVGVDYTILSKQVADMAVKVLSGTAIKDLPVEKVKQYSKIINSKTADSLGIKIPDDIKSEFTFVGK
jgi:putative ABC transport system substrate-binding protein